MGARRYQTAMVVIATSCLVLTSTPTSTAAAAEPPPLYQRPGINELVSVGLDGGLADGPSMTAAMSDDGRYVVFRSAAENLVADEVSGAGDIYRRDRIAGKSQLVSVALGGGSGNGSAMQPAVSADGQSVAFLSYATDLMEGDGGTPKWAQVYVRDMRTGVTERITAGPDGSPANGGSLHTEISADGRYVAFLSHASDLVPDDTNGVGDVFLHDRVEGTTVRISTAPGGGEPDGISTRPAISGDGRWIAFFSRATNLVAETTSTPLTNPVRHAYVRDIHTGELHLVSVASDGSLGNMDSNGGLAVSRDGRYVAFQSVASNLVSHDTNGEANPFDGQDVFVRDRVAGTTERVSVASSGAHLPGKSVSVSISDDGRFVAFQSLKEGEDPQSFVADSDAYVHDRLTRATELLTVAPDGQAGDDDTKNPELSSDGSLVAFQTDATNLVDGQGSDTDVLVRERGPATGVYATRTEEVGDVRTVEGLAGFSGTVLASAAQSPADSGDVAGASIVYRHEQADLLVRLHVPRLPRVELPSATRPLGPTYGLAFSIAGDQYELRAASADAPPLLAAFGLYRCAAVCELAAEVDGGYGTAGEEIRMSLPLSVVGLAPGTTLREVRAFRSVSPFAPAAPRPVELPMADATVPTVTVQLGAAPAGVPGSQVAFGTSADLTAGRFSAAVPWPADAQRLWARACVAKTCDVRTVADPPS